MSTTPPASRALFVATAPAVLLAGYGLAVPALFGAFAALPITVLLPPLLLLASVPLLGLCALAGLWIAAWRRCPMPAWAVLCTLPASVLVVTFALGSMASPTSHFTDASWVWTLRAELAALLAAGVLVASALPGVGAAWSRAPVLGARVLATWVGTALVVGALPPLMAQGARRHALATVDHVPTLRQDPFVMALCDGRLDDARRLLSAGRVAPDARFGVVNCLEHEADDLHPRPTFYPDRVGPALEGLVAAQRGLHAPARAGCTPELANVMRFLLGGHVDSLREFPTHGLPLDCTVTADADPVWWQIAVRRNPGPLAAQLRALQAIGIDPCQRAGSGADLLGENYNHVIATLTDDDLADVIRLGLDPATTGPRTRPFRVELAERRAHQPPGPASAAMQQLLARYGAPTRDDLLRALTMGQIHLGDASPAWDAEVRSRLHGLGPANVAGTAYDTPAVRHALAYYACNDDHACEARIVDTPAAR